MRNRPRPRLRALLAVAALAGVAAGCAHAPAAQALQIHPASASDLALPTAESLRAFRRACPRIVKRPDASALTSPEDWRAACSDSDADPVRFFHRHFTAVQLGNGAGLATGYYEPEIAASRTPVPGAVPILARPAQLVEINLDDWGRPAGRIAGLIAGTRITPVPDRAAIENGALGDSARTLAWTTDRIGYFFLQIQGSGLLRLADGTRLRIGYAGHNGHDYVAIGRLLKERGQLNQVGMTEIRAWLQQHPAAGVRLMQENPRYIFMRELPADVDGPTGALGVSLLPGVNVAADPRYLPLGAPVALATTVHGQPFRSFAIVADTGSAIEGVNRFDIFFGAGAEAAQQAGALAAPLQAVIFLPKAAAARWLSGKSRP